MNNSRTVPTFELGHDGRVRITYPDGSSRNIAAGDVAQAYHQAAIKGQRQLLLLSLRRRLVLQGGGDGVEVDPHAALADMHVRSRELVEQLSASLREAGL